MRTVQAPQRRALALVALVLALAGLAAFLARDRSLPAGPTVPVPPGARGDAATRAVPDPFAWRPDRAADFVARAARGSAHVLYAYSPGGAALSAERTARWRGLVDRTARAASVDANRLEGLVLLESAGREDAMTPAGTRGAVGLTQIVAETGRNLLGLRVDGERSARFTRRIRRELRRGRLEQAERLEAARRRVDERYDPAKALAATGRYLRMAGRRFGREDLAFVSYHMGMGNLEDVLRAYTGDHRTPVRRLVARADLSYAKVYFDSTPRRHAAAQRRLASLGDDSANYLWKVGAAQEIMRLHREGPEELGRQAVLQTAKASAEEVLHPADETERFTSTDALRSAWDDGDLVPFPTRSALTGLQPDPSMGALAARLGEPARLYRGLRPAALAVALYIGAQVRALSGTGPLTVTSTVRDEPYQQLLVATNREATRRYSLHTTGWAFDIARRYRSRAQAQAFQFVLDRLRVLDVIAWAREPAAIHITASEDGEKLLGLLARVGLEP